MGGDKKKDFLKLGFWNVTGIRGKDKEFWERSKKWDVVEYLVKTWLEVKDWEKMKRKIPMGFNWTL